MRASIHISLPTPLRQWVSEQVVAGGYDTESEYIRALLQSEQTRRLRAQIDSNLLEAIESGQAEPLTAADWEEIRREGQTLAESRQRKRAE